MFDLKLEHVSKRYRIRREPEAGADAGALARRLQALRRRSEDFWAVRDVSFEVERGEALGIIGHNGAGKSTILKLLSSITAPTSGEITINGRLSALIEVGSGFHPELTGRENIYLNGSILGMRRRRITEKLDSIVEFAGVRQFLDTPVKRFSSGMYVRLGFSIAAHLDPDILLLDEVLAVGDAAFQSKCLQRIGDLKRAGTTIVFISHDLSAVERLCDRVLLLRRGQIVTSGKPRDVIAEYQNSAFQSSQPPRGELGNQERLVEIGRLSFRDEEGRETSVLRAGEPFTVSLGFTAHAPVPDAVFEVFFYNADRELQCQCTTEVSGGRLSVEPGAGTVEFSGPGLGLLTGVYYTDVVIKERGSPKFFDWSQWNSAALRVDPARLVRGKFFMPCEWRVTRESEADAPAPAETSLT
jgi:ABC-type polysaccharide/polyol phosphate transport system ATPase subunit